jgi:protein gp37
VIVGGESGPGARPMSKEWVVSIRDQCLAAGVPFFFKQWGGVQKSKNGRGLEERTYDEYPAIIPSAPPMATVRAQRMMRLKDRFSTAAIAAE